MLGCSADLNLLLFLKSRHRCLFPGVEISEHLIIMINTYIKVFMNSYFCHFIYSNNIDVMVKALGVGKLLFYLESHS